MANKPGAQEIKKTFNREGLNMAKNKKHKWRNITTGSLESELRGLVPFEPPADLKAGLLAAVPYRHSEDAKKHHIRWYPGVWNFGATAAAAVLIAGLVLLVNYGLSVPSPALLKEFNDTSLCYPVWEQAGLYDQNSFMSDQNNAGVETVWPRN